MKSSSSTGSHMIIRKLAIYGLTGLAVCYILGVAAGYSWLRFERKNDQVSVLDVAFFRIGAIRRGIAAQHFKNAQVEWDKKAYQAAYLFYSAGVRQDPDNVTGRLAAAEFMRALGAIPPAITLLEEGLARAPADRRLIEPTFELLLTSGRDRRALEILKQRHGADFSGPNGLLLQRYEVEATLAAEGAVAAKARVEQYPGLLEEPLAARVVARVLWETQERLKAISVLQHYLQIQKGVFVDYAQLAGWQQSGGQVAEALLTARRAVEKFPSEPSPRVLLIEMLVAENPARNAGSKAVAEYLRDFQGTPESLAELAILGGKKGWVDLCRSLYELGANRQKDLNVLALAYGDALAQVSRFKDVQRVLTALEGQTSEDAVAVWVQLRQRQIIAAAALGDSDNVHEYARRLGSLLGRDPDGLEACRRLFRKLGIAEAVTELSSRTLTVSNTAKK